MKGMSVAVVALLFLSPLLKVTALQFSVPATRIFLMLVLVDLALAICAARAH